MTNTIDYIHQMIVSYPLMEPIAKQAIQSMQLPKGSHGLDAGCGIGLQIPLLADEVGQNGQITGLDISPEFLHHAEKRMRKSSLSEQVSFKEGDIRELPFEDDEFDWETFENSHSRMMSSIGSGAHAARDMLPLLTHHWL